MNSDDYKNRQIIPRWYPFDYACHMGEICSGDDGGPHIWTPFSYKTKQEEWLLTKDLPAAMDFVGSALIANDFENADAIEASGLILNDKEKISNLAKNVAEKFLKFPEPEPNFDLSMRRGHAEKIAMLKKHVRAYPYNAIAWVDMGFYYAVLNQNQKADYCISVAINLSSENRFIMRSAARYYLHINDPERALFLLRRSDVTLTDPWLLASEISIAQAFNIRSKNIKKAESILFTSDVRPRDLAELFGTIATLEANSGSIKKAKKLFRNALMDPNENTVAQVEWIAPQIGFSVESSQNVDASFEADARRFFRLGEYRKTLDSTLRWLRYQPFSARPAGLATYVAGVCLNDHQECLRIIEREAKELIEKDFVLKNNYIFSLASLDRVAEAEKQLLTINSSQLNEKQQATYCATHGLIKFRKGEFDEGRRLYGEAIQQFRKLEEEKGVALASYFWVREEKRIKKDVKEMVAKVVRLAKKLGLKELLQVETDLER